MPEPVRPSGPGTPAANLCDSLRALSSKSTAPRARGQVVSKPSAPRIACPVPTTDHIRADGVRFTPSAMTIEPAGTTETPVSQEQREHSANDADRFVDLVKSAGYWRSIDLRICAIRCDRGWVNLVTRGFLDHRAVGSVPAFSPVERSDFRAWQAVLPITDLPGLVHGIVNGKAKLGQSSVQYVDRSGQPALDARYVFSDLAASYRSASYDPWSCHVLASHGSLMWDVVRQAIPNPLDLDNLIRSGPNAYDGYSDLVRSFCGRPGALEIQRTATVCELIAPLSVRFDRGEVASSPERVSVALRAAAEVFVAKAELVWTVGAAGEPPRHRSAKLDEREWAHEGGALRSRLDVPIRKSDATATLFLLAGGKCVDCVSQPLAEAGSNVRVRTHNVVDPDLRRFLEGLRSESWNKGKEFEEAVGLLFLFLGFQVDPLYAQSGLGDAVDSLAHDPASSVILAIECTVGPPDAKAKLSKLIARSAAMRKKLPEIEVIPVLATATSRAALSKAEVDKAESDDIALLAREDLDGLWALAQAGGTTGHAVSQLRTQVTDARLRRAKDRTGHSSKTKPLGSSVR